MTSTTTVPCSTVGVLFVCLLVWVWVCFFFYLFLFWFGLVFCLFLWGFFNVFLVSFTPTISQVSLCLGNDWCHLQMSIWLVKALEGWFWVSYLYIMYSVDGGTNFIWASTPAWESFVCGKPTVQLYPKLGFNVTRTLLEILWSQKIEPLVLLYKLNLLDWGGTNCFDRLTLYQPALGQMRYHLLFWKLYA